MANPNAATPEEMRALIAGRRSDDPSWFTYGDEVVDPGRVTGAHARGTETYSGRFVLLPSIEKIIECPAAGD